MIDLTQSQQLAQWVRIVQILLRTSLAISLVSVGFQHVRNNSILFEIKRELLKCIHINASSFMILILSYLNLVPTNFIHTPKRFSKHSPFSYIRQQHCQLGFV